MKTVFSQGKLSLLSTLLSVAIFVFIVGCSSQPTKIVENQHPSLTNSLPSIESSTPTKTVTITPTPTNTSTVTPTPTMTPTPAPKYLGGSVYILPEQYKKENASGMLEMDDFYVTGKFARSGFLLGHKIETCQEIADQEFSSQEVFFFEKYTIENTLNCDHSYWYHLTGYQMDSWIPELFISREIAPPFGFRFWFSPDCSYSKEDRCLPLDLFNGQNEVVGTDISEQSIELQIFDFQFTKKEYDETKTLDQFSIFTIRIKNLDKNILVFSPEDFFQAKDDSGTRVDYGGKCSRLILDNTDPISIKPNETIELILEWKPKCPGWNNVYYRMFLSINASIDDEANVKVNNNSIFFKFP